MWTLRLGLFQIIDFGRLVTSFVQGFDVSGIHVYRCATLLALDQAQSSNNYTGVQIITVKTHCNSFYIRYAIYLLRTKNKDD